MITARRSRTVHNQFRCHMTAPALLHIKKFFFIRNRHLWVLKLLHNTVSGTFTVTVHENTSHSHSLYKISHWYVVRVLILEENHINNSAFYKKRSWANLHRIELISSILSNFLQWIISSYFFRLIISYIIHTIQRI